jgi:hypothetical protein
LFVLVLSCSLVLSFVHFFLFCFELLFFFYFVGLQIKKIAAEAGFDDYGSWASGRWESVTGRCSRPVLFDEFLLSHWPTNESPPFASCFWPNFPINSRRRPELGHFRSGLVLVRLILLSSPSTKKDCGSVKASWAERRCSSSRHALPETGPHRHILQPPAWKRHRSPHLDTGPEDGFDSSTSPEGRW